MKSIEGVVWRWNNLKAPPTVKVRVRNSTELIDMRTLYPTVAAPLSLSNFSLRTNFPVRCSNLHSQPQLDTRKVSTSFSIFHSAFHTFFLFKCTITVKYSVKFKCIILVWRISSSFSLLS